MRLALLSDIHGNPIALDAVLTDIQAQGGVDAYWVLGDLAALGYDPVTVIERLVALPGIRFVHGNTDRYVVTGERPPPTLEDVQADPSLLPLLIGVAQSLAWTQGAVTATGRLNWLAELPLQFRQVTYDHEAVIAAVQQSRHPQSAFLIQFMCGEIRSPWAQG